ncbi:hypothetical protein GCM10017771_53090 [Streptomyces capitiformicae]|uniref:Uncharacterized protein n=1 Tax=Streptomyces capitiformicae TaxID=2014920 RepID=A0A918Z416_9ACTN|nr:hypothetical protein GCM10017771_53090 [Streptomyces capitiformicae]
MAYGTVFGAFGEGALPKAATAGAAGAAGAAWADDVADGFASVNALGQNGTAAASSSAPASTTPSSAT